MWIRSLSEQSMSNCLEDSGDVRTDLCKKVKKKSVKKNVEQNYQGNE